MTPSPPARGYSPLRWLVLLGLLGALCPLPAATPAKKSERMLFNTRPVMVEYERGALPQDLELPVYPGAKLERSVAYTIRTTDGELILRYISALFSSADSPAKVVAYYRERLPGNPKPGAVNDEDGERQVLAVASEAEVRMVSVSGRGEGARIELIRAVEPTVEDRPRHPRTEEERIFITVPGPTGTALGLHV